MRRDRDFMGFNSRGYRSMPSGDWHNVNLGPDRDFDWGPDYGRRLSGRNAYDQGYSHVGRRRGRGYDERPYDERYDDPRARYGGDAPFYERDFERDDRRFEHQRDDYGDHGYGDHGRRANRGFDDNYGRGYDREFGRGYERGSGRDFGRDAGPEAREGYTRPGNYDASFERGAYRSDSDRNNDRRTDWGSRDYEHDTIGRGYDYDRDYERRRGDYSTGEGRPYDGGRGLLQREDRYREGPYAGRGPEGYTPSPERIRVDVCERLTHHGHLDASRIRLTVEDSEVTLEGEVDSRWSKRLAEDIAESVRGVRDVHNRLRIDPGMSMDRTDRSTREQPDDSDVAPTASAEPRREQTLTQTRAEASRPDRPSSASTSRPATARGNTETNETS